MTTFAGHEPYGRFPRVQVDGPDDGTHPWIEFSGRVCCGACGVIRRADGQNKPCMGPVHIVLREDAP